MTKRPTFKAKYEATKLIEEHCTKEGGFAKYDSGWSDEKISKQVSEETGPINIDSVKRLRNEMIGPLTTSPTQKLEDRVHDLEERIQELENEIYQLQSLVTKPNQDNKLEALDTKPVPIPIGSSPKFGIPKT